MTRTQRKVLYRTAAVLAIPVAFGLAALTSWLIQIPGTVNLLIGAPFGYAGWFAAMWLWTEVD